MNEVARFWSKVHKLGDGPYDCWDWTGTITEKGYGRFDRQAAHRFAYELVIGPIPDGLQLDHLCRNRICVKPDHLEPVTVRTNILRGTSLMAQRARQTHCKRGHEFTVENTYYFKGTPYRHCRTCHRERDRRLQRERRARKRVAQ